MLMVNNVFILNTVKVNQLLHVLAIYLYLHLQANIRLVRFQVFMATSMKVTAFWDITLLVYFSAKISYKEDFTSMLYLHF
jgi:hypothetical protein